MSLLYRKRAYTTCPGALLAHSRFRYSPRTSHDLTKFHRKNDACHKSALSITIPQSFPTQSFPNKVEMDSTCFEWCEAHNPINSGKDVWRRSLHEKHGYLSILRFKNNIWKPACFAAGSRPPMLTPVGLPTILDKSGLELRLTTSKRGRSFPILVFPSPPSLP